MGLWGGREPWEGGDLWTRTSSNVGDLLDVGRLSGEKLVLKRQEVELGAVVRQAIAAARIGAEAQGQRITLETRPVSGSSESCFSSVARRALHSSGHGG